MNSIRHLVLSALIFGIVLSALPLHSAYAVTNQNAGQALEIAPPVLNLTANPGQAITTKIVLRDVSTSRLVVRNQINDFVANGEDGTPKLLLDDTANDSPYSLKKWVQPLPEFTLNPKQINELPLKINVPKDAAPGGYYAVVRFTATAPGLDGTGVSLSASLGTLVLLRINGDAKEQMKIEQFSTIKNNKVNWLFESQPVSFLARVKNEGSTHEQPTGAIIVSDMFGNKIAGVNVNLTRGNVLPSSIRRFEQTMDKAVIGDRFLFGRYTADLKLTYGTKGQTITESTSFWVIPYRLVAFAVLFIAIIFVVVRIALKRYTERVIERSRSRRRRR